MREFWDARTDTSSPTLEPSQIVFADAICRAAQGRSVLDCGTGGGALAAYVAPSARRVMGVDFSAPMIELARSRFPHLHFCHGDVLTLHLEERFDIICGIGFLHEISVDDTPALIAFLDRHLAPGGFCWFQENSFFNPCARLLRRHVVGRYGVPRYGSVHETPFDPERWALYRVAFRHAVRSAEAFVLWQRVWVYFIRRGSDEPWRAFDRICSRLPDWVKRYTSYIQHVYFSHDVPKQLALNP